jgi:hypothetical protein
MDEIGLFTALRPDPPADGGVAVAAARNRIVAAFGEPSGPARNRSRRKKLALAGGLVTGAAAAAIVVPVMLSPGDGGILGTNAWAVDRNPDGTVTVAFSELFDDPAGLQNTLQAYGVRAEIRVVPMTPLTIRQEPYHGYDTRCVYQTSGLDEPASVQRAVVTIEQSGMTDTRFTIKPSAMPPGSLVFIEIGKYRRGGTTWETTIGPVVLKRPATDCVPRN